MSTLVEVQEQTESSLTAIATTRDPSHTLVQAVTTSLAALTLSKCIVPDDTTEVSGVDCLLATNRSSIAVGLQLRFSEA